MKRLLTMVLTLAMFVTLFTAIPVAAAPDVTMSLSVTPYPTEHDVFKATLTGVADATWVVWTVTATNDTENDTTDDVVIYLDQKSGAEAAENGFSFTFVKPDESTLFGMQPFSAEAKVFFADSTSTTVTGTFEYNPYSETQGYIREILLDKRRISAVAVDLGITLPTYYVDNDGFDNAVLTLLNDAEDYPAGYAVKKNTIYNAENLEETNIAADQFYTDLNKAILHAALNNKNTSSISSILTNNSADVDAAVEAAFVTSEEFSDWYASSENKSAIDSKLATYTYETIDDFVNQFNSLVFLDRITTKSQEDILEFLNTNDNKYKDYGEQEHLDADITDEVKTLDLDFDTLNGYIEDDADNKATAEYELATTAYENLSDIKTKFNDLIERFGGEASDPEPSNPGSPAPGPSGPAISVTPSAPIVVEDGVDFKDLDSVPWAKEAIEALANEGVIAGVSKTEFKPNENVTREQFVQIIVKTFGLKGSGTPSAFVDVDQNAWYAGAVNTAVELGIISGVGDNKFAVGAIITRQDMASIMYRVAQYLGINLPAKYDRVLTDEASINSYAVDAVNTLYKAGIINGVSEGVFGGSQVASRAQAAKLCYDLRGAKN